MEGLTFREGLEEGEGREAFKLPPTYLPTFKLTVLSLMQFLYIICSIQMDNSDKIMLVKSYTSCCVQYGDATRI